MAEQVFVAQPLSSASGRVIASPFQFWTTGEDNLRVVSVCSLPGVNVKIQGRGIDANGVIWATSWDHQPTSNRTAMSMIYPLAPGAVLNLTVFASAGTPTTGQCFIIVQLVRGTNPGAIVLGTLLQGYVTSTQNLGWPGSPIQSSLDGPGAIRSITGTTPAPGAEIAETVPTGARWQLLSLGASFAPQGAMHTCQPALVAGQPGVVEFYVPVPGTVSPPNSIGANWAIGLALPGITLVPRSVAGLPTDMPLLAGAFIQTITAGIFAGDTWGAPAYTVREWLEVN